MQQVFWIWRSLLNSFPQFSRSNHNAARLSSFSRECNRINTQRSSQSSPFQRNWSPGKFESTQQLRHAEISDVYVHICCQNGRRVIGMTRVTRNRWESWAESTQRRRSEAARQGTSPYQDDEQPDNDSTDDQQRHTGLEFARQQHQPSIYSTHMDAAS